MKGIDVSHHQKKIDWKAVKAEDFDFAIIHAGYGNDPKQKDPYFENNMAEAMKNNIHVGAYWFSYAYTIAGAIKEAEVFLNIMKVYKQKATFPLCFDWEYDSLRYAREHGIEPDSKLVSGMACAFLERLKQDGWAVMNYQNHDLGNRYFNTEEMKQYDLWLADYSTIPAKGCKIQQTTDKGKIPNLSQNFDMNVSYKDYPRFIKENHLNGF